MDQAKGRYFAYNVKFVCGIQRNKFDKECDAILNHGIYTTAINILNYGKKVAKLRKMCIPLVVQNKAIARETESKTFISREDIALKPFHGTMDDCCKIAEMLKEAGADAQLKIGFLEIISTQPLEVVAVYSVTNVEQMHPSISVVQIQAKPLSFS